MSELKNELLDILKVAGKPISFKEIITSLKSENIQSLSVIRSALTELERERQVISFKNGKTEPVELYRYIEKNMIGSSVTRDDFEETEKKKLLRCLIDDSTGRYTTLPQEELRKVFSNTAERLLHEDPRELFLKFAEWLKENHASEVNKFREAINSGKKEEAQRYNSNIQKIEECCLSVFSRMLGVPFQLRSIAGDLRPGPFFLKLNKATMEDTSVLDKAQLSKYLNYVIRGNHVVDILKLEDKVPPMHIGGSDASIQSIDLSGVLPWQVEPSEINIITALGVRYDIYKGIRNFDRRPDPKVLAQYERRQAIEEGFLIPPAGTMGFAMEMEKRIKEAAMDLRQFTKDFEMMFTNEPTVKVHFRDGRVFPLEHRLSDALQIDIHGEIVRSSLKVFRNIVNMVEAENGETLFCGFVKRPGVDIIAPLITWFIGFGSATSAEGPIDAAMSLEDFFRSPYSDTYIISRLFSSLNDKLANNELYVTFRLIRRFQSMEEPYVQNFEPTTDRKIWTERLHRYSKETFGGVADDSGAEIIANLCARAAIVQVYCSLVSNPDYEPRTSIPRIEFLLPHSDFEKTLSADSTETSKEQSYLRRILSTMFYPGVLEPYPDQLFFESANSPEIFIAPRPVCDAHISSKEIAKIYRDDFVELLMREAKEYWQSRKLQVPRK
jgi:hypothetical protein